MATLHFQQPAILAVKTFSANKETKIQSSRKSYLNTYEVYFG
jgi:hypothetical protein